MTPLEHRVLSRSLLIGGILALGVLFAGWLGFLDSLEYWLYDQRATFCQLDEPSPSDRIVHIDIDDASVSPDALARWPWPRATIAALLDEIHRAGPGAIALDILFSEPQRPELVEEGDGKLTRIEHDVDLAEALKRCGNAILATSFLLESPGAKAAEPAPAVKFLETTLETTQEEFARQAAGWGPDVMRGVSVEDLYLRSRREAMRSRIYHELDADPGLTQASLLHRLLPHADPDEDTPIHRLFNDQFALVAAERGVERFGAPARPMSLQPARGTFNVVPLAMFSSVAADCAFANYDIFEGATVRAMPMFVEYDNRLYPQLGLATACTLLGANIQQVRFEGSTIVIPCPSGDIRIPTYTYHSKVLGRDVPLIAALPWFGGRKWETMYDWPQHLMPTQHISMASIWDICQSEKKILRNSATIDQAISDILDKNGVDPDLAKKYSGSLPDPMDVAARRKMADLVFPDAQPFVQQFATTPDAQLSANERQQKLNLNDAIAALHAAVTQSTQLQIQLTDRRQWLAKQIGRKAVLIGFTATGFQDQVNTSIHQRCPGVVVHGVIVNAVLDSRWWTMAPWWVTALLTMVLGMTAATVQGRFPPLRAAFIVGGILVAYFLVNGFIIFDWDKWIVGLATPSVAMAVVWGGTTLDRLIVIGVERHRIALEVAAISKEMDLARNVQVALIPKSAPMIVGLESGGWALTASVTGGDCYDLWQLKDGRLAVLLADASGHGLAPAMVVSQVRTLCRSLCDFEAHPQGLLDRVNHRLADDLEPNRFVTAFLGFLSPDGTLDWSSAGHGPMYWCPSPTGEMVMIDSTGLPLGIQHDCFTDPPTAAVHLDKGGSLIVFSDGIFEAHAPITGELFSVERVKEILDQTRGQSVDEVIAAMRAAVQKWQAKLEPDDDQTIVVVRRV
jgi:CHASE2 domain-containing sensor protein